MRTGRADHRTGSMAASLRPLDEFGPHGRGRVALTGFGIGFWSGLAFVPLALDATLWHWSVYCTMLSYFHISEYLLTARYRPDTLSYDNFLVNHSKAYTAAVLMSWVEFWVARHFLPSLSSLPTLPVRILGAVLSALGLAARGLGMVTAGSNFSHIIELDKRPEHTLVTHGIYAVLRHPAYFGFFWFSIGTQVLLCNPVCTCLYALASWRFFADRIPGEEAILVDFFGDEYASYMRKTYVGIPWIDSRAPAT